MEKDTAIIIEGLKKRYRLGVIGGGTLQGDIQSLWARIRGKEDPNVKIGKTARKRNETFMALDGVDLTVYKGERLGIIGHNGAGKSTLLKILSRITAPTEGEVRIDGRISSMLEVGTGFNRELTGRENIYLNGAILGMTKAEVDSKIDRIIDFSECRQFIDTPVKRYSSGMYVKLAFSVAAHLDSEILLMDEVLAVGDMAFQKKCIDKMNEVSANEGRTILYVSHNMNTIRRLCDRCVVIDRGKIIYNGGVEEAIGVYLNIAVGDETEIDYSNKKELFYQEHNGITSLLARFEGKSDNIFTRGEKQIIHFEWKNDEDIKNLCLRIEFFTRDRTPLGAALIYDFYSGEKGDRGQADFLFDTSLFAQGKYASSYAFFTKNDFGNTKKLDYMKGLDFNIAKSVKDIVWSRKNWGNIRFPDIELLKKEAK